MIAPGHEKFVVAEIPDGINRFDGISRWQRIRQHGAGARIEAVKTVGGGADKESGPSGRTRH